MISVIFCIKGLEDVLQCHLFDLDVPKSYIPEISDAIEGERDYNHSEFDIRKINYKD